MFIHKIEWGVLLFLALADFGTAQQGATIEANSQPAVNKLREVARTIRECPEAIETETKWGKGPLEISRLYIGPPKNVVWDVVPSKTVRSPYAGYIEFSTSHYVWVPPETSAKYERQHPGFRAEAAIRLKDWKLRYEFDVGPGGVEITRALSRLADASDWGDFSKRDICWDNAARKGQTVDKAK